MLVLCSLDYLVVVQGVAEVLFVGYVIVWGRPALLPPSVNAGLGEVVVVVVVCSVYHALSFMCIRTEIMGGLATIGAVVPEPAIPTFLGVLLVIIGSSAGVDCWYHAS